LPEAHRHDQSRFVVLATLAGAIGIYLFTLVVASIGADAH
jgi:hypothetical protein